MFGSIRTFTNQFTPGDGGYLYYPSRKTGGKFVSDAEYDRLLADWRRVAGLRPFLISVGLMVLAGTLGIFAQVFLDLPFWINWIVFAAICAALFARLSPPGLAPRRLVESRPTIAPPRPRGQAERQARAVLSWPLVMIVLAWSGFYFVTHVASPDRTATWWAFIIGSGFLFGSYSWLAIRKLMDRRHSPSA